MRKGVLIGNNVVIKHLDSPNITTFVDGKMINIRNHQATVDVPTAKRIMEGPWGYELVGVYDDFKKYVSEIDCEKITYSDNKSNDEQHVLIATPLTGHKIYSWDKYVESLMSLEGRENTSVVFTVDEKAGKWVDELKIWAKKNSNKFISITLLLWDHDEEMAWNRVFKITVGRQLIFNFARQSNMFSHVWFVDSDMVHKADSLKRLLRHARDLTAGIYNFKAVMNGGPVAFNARGDDRFPFTCLGDQITSFPKDSETIEVDWTGAGSLLLTRKIFESIDFDWSKWIQRHGEDAWICMLGQKQFGKKLLVDLTVHPGHLDELGKEW